MKPRAVFYPTDEETDLMVKALCRHIQDMGLKGPASDAVRFSIHYAAKALGLKRSEPSGASFEVDDPPWPWCDACKSWHHPKNPTCRKREATQAPKRRRKSDG